MQRTLFLRQAKSRHAGVLHTISLLDRPSSASAVPLVVPVMYATPFTTITTVLSTYLALSPALPYYYQS